MLLEDQGSTSAETLKSVAWAGFVDELEKIAFDWKKFREGVRDEGIPLSGATMGAALGAIAKAKKFPLTPLTGAALGYAFGSGASLAHAKMTGKKPSLSRKLLALSGLGYGLGSLSHGGIKTLSKGMKPGSFKTLFHGTGGMRVGKSSTVARGLEALGEEGLPALGATLGAGYALGSHRGRGGH